jgi:hypothetical protein
MTLKLMLWFKDLLEVMFFTGLVGCSLTVILSWISILKSAFSNDDEE